MTDYNKLLSKKIDKAKKHAVKMCDAREKVIQAAKAWFPSDTRGFKWIPLQEAVRKLIKLEAKYAKGRGSR